MHIIQRNILANLIHKDSCRYRDLKPSDIESNHFMYHLKVVQREGLVEKQTDGYYCLTPAGKLYVDQLSLQNFRPRAQPKIVTLLACQNQKGDWLTLQRANQPLRGQIGFPYGKLHLGEDIESAAHRELQEKTHLTVNLEHRGDGYILIYESGQVVSHICFHLFYGKNPQGTLRVQSKAGTVQWSAARADFSSPPYMSSMGDIIHQLQSTPKEQRFFVELTYRS